MEDRSWAHQESPWERVEPSQEKVALRPSSQILGPPVLELGHVWVVQLQGPIRSLRCVAWLSLAFDTLSWASEMLLWSWYQPVHLSSARSAPSLRPCDPSTPLELSRSPFPFTMKVSDPTSPNQPGWGHPKFTKWAQGEDSVRWFKLDRQDVRNTHRADANPQVPPSPFRGFMISGSLVLTCLPPGRHYLPAFLLFPFQVAEPQQVFLLGRQLPWVWTDRQLVTGCSHRPVLGLSQLFLKLSNLRMVKTHSTTGLQSDSTTRRSRPEGRWETPLDRGHHSSRWAWTPHRRGTGGWGRDLRWHLEKNKGRHGRGLAWERETAKYMGKITTSLRILRPRS